MFTTKPLRTNHRARDRAFLTIVFAPCENAIDSGKDQRMSTERRLFAVFLFTLRWAR